MTLNLRTYLFCNLKHPRICNDQCIRFNLSQLFKIFSYPFKIIVVGKNICCNIHFYIMCMCEFYSLFHFFHRKIFCFRTQPKCFSSDIYCISTENYSCF